MFVQFINPISAFAEVIAVDAVKFETIDLDPVT
jgi:hypothetical protein